MLNTPNQLKIWPLMQSFNYNAAVQQTGSSVLGLRKTPEN